MKITVALAWACCIGLISLLAFSGCSGSMTSEQPENAIPSIAQLLPDLPIDTERDVTALVADTKNGSDVIDQSATGTSVIGDDLEFTTGQDLAYGMWQFPGIIGALFLNAETSVTFGESSEYFVAVSNYTQNRWDISGPYNNNAQIPFTPGTDYTSDHDNFYIVVIAWDFSTGLVHEISLNYEDNPSRYSISGTIVDGDGLPVPDIDMLISPLPLFPGPVTNAQGDYIFENLSPSVVTITPISATYEFEPSSHEVWVVNENVTGVDFVASIGSTIHSISGTILDDLDAPMAGVTITATPGGAHATSAANGTFTIADLADSSYTLTPTLTDHDFTPASRLVNLSGSDVTGIDYVGTYSGPLLFSISGTVLDDSSSPIAGSSVTIEPGTHVANVDGSGAYTVADLIAGEYIATPSADGYSFTPTFLPIDIVDADITNQNFVGTATSTPTYDGEIAGMLSGCTGCHGGLSEPQFNTYATASANAATIWAFVETNPNHNFLLPWDDANKDTFKAWLDGGTPEN